MSEYLGSVDLVKFVAPFDWTDDKDCLEFIVSSFVEFESTGNDDD